MRALSGMLPPEAAAIQASVGHMGDPMPTRASSFAQYAAAEPLPSRASIPEQGPLTGRPEGEGGDTLSPLHSVPSSRLSGRLSLGALLASAFVASAVKWEMHARCSAAHAVQRPNQLWAGRVRMC